MTMIIIGFIIGLLTDWIWTRCIKNVSAHNPFWAANWSVGIYMCGIVSTMLIVEKDIGGILAYLVGGYVGTYLGVKYGGNLTVPDKS